MEQQAFVATATAVAIAIVTLLAGIVLKHAIAWPTGH